MERKRMSALRSLRRGIFSPFFEYETEKIVQINSVKIGIIYHCVMLFIAVYVVGWVMIHQKGYQETDTLVSAVVTKVKGVSLTNRSDMGVRVWDVADYVVPPQEKDSLFITTNAVITAGQVQSKCPENPTIAGARCTKDEDCTDMETIMMGNGVKTGLCLNTTFPGSEKKTKSCEIYAWCPVEDRSNSELNKPLLGNAENFTIFVKNSIEFPQFKKKLSNILDTYNSTTIAKCKYDPEKEPYCPIISLGTMLQLANVSYKDIASEGGIIAINIEWRCDFDWPDRFCKPKYSFRRLDVMDVKLAKGWNFRYANYYNINGTNKRDVFKVYGIRIVIYVTGEAGRFSFFPLTMNLGSGVALFGIATVLCDFLVIYALKKRKHYREAKFEVVKVEDCFNGLRLPRPKNIIKRSQSQSEAAQKEDKCETIDFDVENRHLEPNS